MSMINCPECGKELSDSAVSCVNCGHRLKAISHKAKKVITVLVIIVLIIGISGYRIYENNKEQMMINQINRDVTENKKKFNEAINNYNETHDQKYLDESNYYLSKMKRSVGIE